MKYNRDLKTLDALRGMTQNDEEERAITEAFNQLAEKVNLGIENADFLLKRQLLKLLIKVIEVHRDEIRVIFRIPARPFLQSPVNSGQLQHCLLSASTPPASLKARFSQ